MTVIERAKDFIRLNGPYWRLLQWVPGVGFSLIDKWVGDEEAGIGPNDLETGLDRFEKILKIVEGNKGRLQLYVKNKPQSKTADERGPYGFDLSGGAAPEKDLTSQNQPLAGQNFTLGLGGLNPTEILHLQRETMQAGLTDQRNLLEREKSLEKEYADKHDKLREERFELQFDRNELAREKKDWERLKREERAELERLRRKYEERSEVVKAGATRALEGLLSGFATGGQGLAGVPAEEPEEQLTPQEEIAGDLAQFLVDEVPDLQQLEAIAQFVKRYVNSKKVSQTQATTSNHHPNGQHRPQPGPEPDRQPDNDSESTFA